MNYTSKQVRRIIECYQELRSMAEIVSTRFDHVHASGKSFDKSHGMEEIICTMADLDQAIKILSPRQKEVVSLVRAGCGPEKISSYLDITMPTYKYHLSSAILRITTYLNSHLKLEYE